MRNDDLRSDPRGASGAVNLLRAGRAALSLCGAVALALILSHCDAGGGNPGTASSQTESLVPKVGASSSPSSTSVLPFAFTQKSAAITHYTATANPAQPGMTVTQAKAVQPKLQSVTTGPLLFSDNFNNGTGQWNAITPTWSICEPNSFYGFNEYCNTGQPWGVSLATAITNATWTDYRFETNILLPTNVGGAAIIARYQDPGDFYEFQIQNVNGQRCWFIWKQVNSAWTELAGGALNINNNEYYRLRFDNIGPSLAASISSDAVNFTLLGAVSDSTFSSGTIGFETFGGVTPSFSYLDVTSLVNSTPIPVPSTSPTPSTPTAQFAISVPLAVNTASPQNLPVAQSLRIKTANQPDTLVDLTAASTACTLIGSGRNCQAGVPTALGPQTFTVIAYDGPAGTGNQLIQSTHSETIANGANQPIAVTYNNVPVAAYFTLHWGDLATGGINGIQAPLNVFFSDLGGNRIPDGTTLINPTGATENIQIGQDDASGKTVITNGLFNQSLSSTPATVTETGHITSTIHLLANSPTGALLPRGTTTMPIVTASKSFTYVLGPEQIVSSSVPAGMDYYRNYFPDAHFSVVPEANNQCQMMWGIAENWRSLGNNCYPQNQGSATKVWSPLGDTGTLQFINNGAWILSMYRQSPSNLIAFFHGENGSDPIAYDKTMGVVQSTNDGQSWGNPARIFMPAVTPQPSPNQTPIPNMQVDGDGDGLVLWDWFNSRWFGMANENLVNNTGKNIGYGTMIAQSTDPNAQPGTWYKWYNGSYSQPGLGGNSTYVLSNLGWVGNPSIVWNTYLGEWIIAGDGGSQFFTTSQTLDDWTAPTQTLIPGVPSGVTIMYPTMMGQDDKVGGQNMILYYAYFDASGNRSFRYRTMTFERND